MKITWYGHAAFLIETGGTRIILDPYRSPDSGGYAPIDEPADLVVVSHENDRYHSHLGQIVPPFEVIRALELLKRNPELYRTMVENGRARGREFTNDAIAARWREVLAGPVARGFDRWQRTPAIKRLYRPALFAVRAIAQAIEVRRHCHSRDHGFRPLSKQYT